MRHYDITVLNVQSLETISQMGKSWYKIALSKLRKTNLAIFEDAKNAAGELIYSLRNTKGRIITCSHDNRIYGLAILRFNNDKGNLTLKTLVTDPRNIKAKSNPSTDFTQVRGVGSALIYEVLMICLKEQIELDFWMRKTALAFYHKIGLLDEIDSFLPYCKASVEKIRRLINNFPLPPEVELHSLNEINLKMEILTN